MGRFAALLLMAVLLPGIAAAGNPLNYYGEPLGELPEGAGVEWFYGKWNPNSTNSQIGWGYLRIEKGWIHYEKDPFSSEIRLIQIDKNGAVFLERDNSQKFAYSFSFLYFIPKIDRPWILFAYCDGWDDSKLTEAHWHSSDTALKAFWDGHERCNPRFDKTGGKYPLTGWSTEWLTRVGAPPEVR
jgi:hypothetical protein